MAFVVSSGALRALDHPAVPASYTLKLAGDRSASYAWLWRTQPAVRTVVEFLARNIASLGLHSYRRVSDTDRERLTEHSVARLIARPNPYTTTYRLLHALVSDLAIFDDAYWAKVRAAGQYAVVRLPPERVEPEGDNWLAPQAYRISGSKGELLLPADRIVHFRGYHPRDSRVGCSPVEALRRILVEEWEAGRMREQVLRNGARISGYLERPAEAPRWSGDAKDRFKADWHAQYASDGPSAGGTPILEDGMTFHPASQTAEQLQYVEARKLTREEVASAYFIPPPMIGILDHATFSNITEQHKMLYQDTLGPWLAMICQEIGLQLLADLPDAEDVYVEFNLSEKLRGSFEEQAQQLQTAVGAPWLTRNEARARMNLSSLDGGDELITPLNVLAGGQASPTDSAPDSAPNNTSGTAPDEADTNGGQAGRSARTVLMKARATPDTEYGYIPVLQRFFRRQATTVTPALGITTDSKTVSKAVLKALSDMDDGWWDGQAWDRELAAELYRLATTTTETVATTVLDDLGQDTRRFDPKRMYGFLAAHADRVAEGINATTKAQLDQALSSEDPAGDIARVFEVAEGSRAEQIATTVVTALSAFATVETARQLGEQTGSQARKTWVTGPNPRPSHAAMDGETVVVDEVFSNGADWPGDAALGPEETAGCNCSLSITID